MSNSVSEDVTLRNASIQLMLYGCVVSVCGVYVYCVESFAHIECYSDWSRRWIHLVELFCYGVICAPSYWSRVKLLQYYG